MKKIFTIIIFSGLFLGIVSYAQTVAGNSSVSAKKQSNGYYTITIKDPQGLKHFALKSPGNLPYSGDLAECPRVFVVDNVSPAVVNDFSGEVDADITDCQNNDDELQIPEIGDKKSIVGKHEEPPTPSVAPASATSIVPSETAPAATELTAIGGPTEITYPVKELGGCADKDTCKVYCEEPGNMQSCVNFAEKHNLISEKEAEDGRKFSSIVNSRGGGPGGCKTRESCEAYCENTDNIDACLAFAEDSDLVPAKDLEDMRKISKLLKEGEKFPGGCKSKSQCEAYCAEPDNMEACLTFAEKAGFIPPEELAMAKKVVPLMKAGKTPGGCKSKEACESYCGNPDHLDACIAFGEQTGAISPEEVAIIKKTGGKGPGDCRGRKQCDAFCQIPENQETCFNFGKDNGLIPPEDLQKMEEGMKFVREALNDESSELGQCLSAALGSDNVARAKASQPIFDRGLENKLRGCFEQFPPQGMSPGGGQGGGFPGGGSTGGQFPGGGATGGNFPGGQGGFSGGPGGCKSPEECQSYCQEKEHQEECQKFTPPGGGQGGGGGGFPGGPVRCGTEENPEECQQIEPPHRGGSGGPGGCTNPEECQAYCQEHFEECQGFEPPGGGGSGGGGSSSNSGGSSTGGDSQSCVQPPSGLVSWWSADVASGNTAPDINNGNNNGTIVGGVTLTPMEVGNAFQFDGRSGYINMGNPGSLNFGTGPFSLEAWFNWTGEGAGKVVNNIIRKSNYGSSAGPGYWLRIGAELEFSVGATNGPDGQSIIMAPISAGEWHHAVATKDSSGNIQLYVDGQPQGKIIRQAASSESTSGSSFTIGSWHDQRSEFFHGSIDEVAVYNRALGASEVKTLFDSGSVGKCSAGYGRTNRDLPQDYQQQYQEPPQQSQPPSGGNFREPGGCTNPEECQAYCTKNYMTDPACQQSAPPSPSGSLQKSSLLAKILNLFKR